MDGCIICSLFIAIETEQTVRRIKVEHMILSSCEMALKPLKVDGWLAHGDGADTVPPLSPVSSVILWINNKYMSNKWHPSSRSCAHGPVESHIERGKHYTERTYYGLHLITITYY